MLLFLQKKKVKSWKDNPIPIDRNQVRAIAAHDRLPHRYFLVADGRLWAVEAGSLQTETIAALPTICETGSGGDGRLKGKPLALQLHVRAPWLCVTERFGVNAALVNLDSGKVQAFRREDYHSDVSSYSAAFLEQDGQISLLLQTLWNRLDLYDPATGENRTPRAVSYDPKRNYLDYFHSILHVSPDSRYFLSNGWHWAPCDRIRAFSTTAFLRSFEPGGVALGMAYSSGYNWDRPCCFINDHDFVAILDTTSSPFDEDEADERILNAPYLQLAFFTLPDDPADWTSPLKAVRLADCECFPRDACNGDGEAKGGLSYNPHADCLVVLTEDRGAFALSLEGKILAHLPETSLGQAAAHGDIGSSYGTAPQWDYAPHHSVLYRWTPDGVEERHFP